MRIEEEQFIDFISKKYVEPITIVDVGANIGKFSECLVDGLGDKIKKGFYVRTN